MKKKTLLEIVIKIIGLFAAWTFITSLGMVFSVFGIFSMFTNGGVQSSFMLYVSLNMLLTFVIPGIIAYFALFKTGVLLKFLNHGDDETLDVRLDPYLIFYLLVLVFAFSLFINGCNYFMTYNYNTETNNQMTSLPGAEGQFQNNTSVRNTETKNVNYFALIEIIIAVFVFIKAVDVSNWLGARFGSSYFNQNGRTP
jgi:hypothetical protein